MTETQAMSGAAGAPANPVDQDGGDAAAPATGRAAVGRATVPADNTEPAPNPDAAAPDGAAESGDATSASPTFARPPGMPPPPEPDGQAATRASDGTDRKSFAGRTAAGMATVRGAAGNVATGAVRVTEAMRASRSTPAASASRGPRRARLGIKRIDPWSVLKFSFAVSFVLLVVIVVATSVLYLALDRMDVFDQINGTLADLLAQNGSQDSPFKITASGVIGTSAILGAINILLFTSLSTLGAFIYNVCADLVGGIEITLAERD